MTARQILLMTSAAELAASLTALQLTLRHHAQQADAPWTWLVGGALVLCLAVMSIARFLQLSYGALAGAEPWMRRLALSMGVSLSGWVGLIVLFALRVLRPDLDLPPAFLLAAFAVHIAGAVASLYELRDRTPGDE